MFQRRLRALIPSSRSSSPLLRSPTLRFSPTLGRGDPLRTLGDRQQERASITCVRFDDTRPKTASTADAPIRQGFDDLRLKSSLRSSADVRPKTAR